MNDDEILAIIMFLKLKMTMEQFNGICKYITVDYISYDTDGTFMIHISSRITDKIKCNIKIIDVERKKEYGNEN